MPKGDCAPSGSSDREQGPMPQAAATAQTGEERDGARRGPPARQYLYDS